MLKSEIAPLVKSTKTNDTDTVFWATINGIRYRCDFGEFQINGKPICECYKKIEFIDLVYKHVNKNQDGESKSV